MGLTLFIGCRGRACWAGNRESKKKERQPKKRGGPSLSRKKSPKTKKNEAGTSASDQVKRGAQHDLKKNCMTKGWGQRKEKKAEKSARRLYRRSQRMPGI